MADWTDIPDGVLEPGDPIRSVDMIALRDNISAIAERASGAPSVLGTLTSVQRFDSSGTWTKPSGINYVMVEVIGAGGDGGSTTSTNSGSGGGGGGYSRKLIDVSGISSATVTVGTAPGGTSSWADGTNTVSATGGADGAINSEGGAGGSGSGGDFNGAGNPGGGALSGSPGGNGGGTIYGGGGVGSTAGDGTNGVGIGAGGGGARSTGGSQTGGSGADGKVIVTEYR